MKNNIAHCLMMHEHCRDGFDRAPEHNVNDTAAVAVPILHKEGGVLPRAVRALLLASLCGLAAIPAPAVTPVASNLKVSVNGDKVVLSWTGIPGVLYQAQGATDFGVGKITDWQNIDAPT